MTKIIDSISISSFSIESFTRKGSFTVSIISQVSLWSYAEYVEDPELVAENERYKELFGDISIYEGRTTRVTNGEAITYTVREFSEDVRKFVEKYGHLTHFVREFNEMIDEGKEEYRKSIDTKMDTTMSIYAHVIEEADQKSAKHFDDFFKSQTAGGNSKN
ncbi:hypothetical protein PJ311_10895 [Bacillus sp. CLL-7-23]|uniref:Uncharacterized protein n=1 Tax=Bacillus changyiensis TaxID=3004103 RepID=A0ABT4X491_9BACI|nr:hypothetical protein [Bacillus changyiensis]MDA7027116.1 hypothetical protein [Bacillus changyiensis]